jgi:hypothetical protein
MSYIEKLLALSTEHMPSGSPDFGELRTIKHGYGYIIFVSEPQENDIPEWLAPIIMLAYAQNCTLILFDRDANQDPDFQSWDW